MLDTLLKIGKWQKEGVDEWSRFLASPKVNDRDRHDKPITNYILPIIFDLDESKVIIDPSNLIEYDKDKHLLELKAIKILGGNNKSIYLTTQFDKIIQLYKTLFGKSENNETGHGELFEFINREYPKYIDTNLTKILKGIYDLKSEFMKHFTGDDPQNEGQGVDHNVLKQRLGLGKNDNIVLVYTCVKSGLFGCSETAPLSKDESYISFLRERFIGSETELNKKNDIKLCYASGINEKFVDSINLTNRYSLNKMFVTETKNYASDFKGDNFNLNYQVSKENQEYLDFASNYLINNYKVKIAGLDHVIIPQFQYNEKIDFSLVLEGIKKNSDVLFSIKSLKEMAENISIETDNIFWLNFLAFESDGNFFKTTGIIKDVSKFHFNKVLNAFSEIDKLFRETSFVDWDSVMTEYGNKGIFFNMNSVYNIIPLRKDKEKKNIALDLFKAILENRKIDSTQLFKHFSELILCHYFERYKNYTNIQNSNKDYFIKTIRDCVFKYLAFIQVLKNLNLINMKTETKEEVNDEIRVNKYDQDINDFFVKTNYTSNQKAMFFLGRMLNAVVYIQKDKNKTVIDKLNYNGMGKDKIVRLRCDLYEKAKQYGKTNKIIFDDNRFSEFFNFQTWEMDPNEALFFILTGFSFGAKQKEESAE